MYVLKHLPEDFLVEEITNRTWQSQGDFTIVKVTKKQYNTDTVAGLIASSLRVKARDVSYAGNKDYHALTTQFMSIKSVQPSKISSISIPRVNVSCVGFSDEPLSLGDLQGNSFKIIIRNLDPTVNLKPKSLVPNFFDQQRFGANNLEVGKALLKRDFKQAAHLIIEQGGHQAQLLTQALSRDGNDVIGALRCIPKKVLRIYVHAFQSHLFNILLTNLLRHNPQEESLKLPLIGFATNIAPEVQLLLDKESLSTRDFIFREFPDLSSEGTIRSAFVEVTDLIIHPFEPDECFAQKYKCLVTFSLPKGAYATNVIMYLQAK